MVVARSTYIRVRALGRGPKRDGALPRKKGRPPPPRGAAQAHPGPAGASVRREQARTLDRLASDGHRREGRHGQARLCAETRRVIAFEMQAHGRTAEIDRPLSMEQIADDTIAALQHLGIEEANF